MFVPKRDVKLQLTRSLFAIRHPEQHLFVRPRTATFTPFTIRCSVGLVVQSQFCATRFEDLGDIFGLFFTRIFRVVQIRSGKTGDLCLLWDIAVLMPTPSTSSTARKFITSRCRMIFTARRHASAVYAVVVCLSVCLSVCHKSVFY